MDQITTYATLQSAVAGTLHRAEDTDITGNAPLWIQLLEAELNDRLLLKDQEQEDTLAATIDQNYVALPSGFVSPIALWLIVDTIRVPLNPVLPQQLPYEPSSSQPRHYAIDGVNIRFDCPALEAYSLKFRYYKKSNLSASNTSNYLLLKRPDIYLYGTLKHACLFTEDDNGAKKWATFFEDSIAQLKNAEHRARAAVPLRSDIPTKGRSNILIGE